MTDKLFIFTFRSTQNSIQKKLFSSPGDKNILKNRKYTCIYAYISSCISFKIKIKKVPYQNQYIVYIAFGIKKKKKLTDMPILCK